MGFGSSFRSDCIQQKPNFSIEFQAFFLFLRKFFGGKLCSTAFQISLIELPVEYIKRGELIDNVSPKNLALACFSSKSAK